MRRAAFGDALALARAWAEVRGRDVRPFDEQAEERAALGAAGMAVPPLVTSADLVARGLKPGPDFGAILRDAETLQLDGALATRAAALEWIDGRLRDGRV
jgi:hypothetical protein